MKQTTLSKLEAILTPDQLDFRLKLADWLNKYPWTHLWTPTFKKAEEAGGSEYTRGRGYDLKTGQHTGGGAFKANPFWKEGREAGLHASGFSEDAAIRTTKKFMKKHMKDYSWFFCAEKNPGRDGHHVHSLLVPPAGGKVDVAGLSAKWWRYYGWNKFERVKSKGEVTLYCTKHVCEYLNKGDGWYEIEINDSELYHNATRTGS